MEEAFEFLQSSGFLAPGTKIVDSADLVTFVAAAIYAERQKHVKCRTCGDKGWIIVATGQGEHGDQEQAPCECQAAAPTQLPAVASAQKVSTNAEVGQLLLDRFNAVIASAHWNKHTTTCSTDALEQLEAAIGIARLRLEPLTPAYDRNQATIATLEAERAEIMRHLGITTMDEDDDEIKYVVATEDEEEVFDTLPEAVEKHVQCYEFEHSGRMAQAATIAALQARIAELEANR
jgi:hypothetical protein